MAIAEINMSFHACFIICVLLKEQLKTTLLP